MLVNFENVAFSLFFPLLIILSFLIFSWLQSLRKLPVEGKAVLITGCDSGIGYRLALHFYRKGLIVFAACLSLESDGGRSLRDSQFDSYRMHVLPLDVTKRDTVEEAVRCVELFLRYNHLPGLWGLINNAGICIYGEADWLTWDQCRRMIDVNLMGTITVTKSFQDLVVKANGRIVNVGSVNGSCAYPGLSVYSATKFAIEGWSDALRYELAKFGVKVVLMKPGDFAKLTNIMGAHQRAADEMWAEMSATKRSLYGDYFKLYHEFILKNYGMTSPSSFEQSTLLPDFEEALLGPNPRLSITIAPIGFRLFFTLLHHLPVSCRSHIIHLLFSRVFSLPPIRENVAACCVPPVTYFACESYQQCLNSIENHQKMENLTNFTLTFYQSLASASSANIVFSPFSVSCALLMIFFGSKGPTATQLIDTLFKADFSGESIDYVKNLSQKVNLIEGINVTNFLFVDNWFRVDPQFVAKLEDYFESRVKKVNFANETQKAIRIMNQDVSRATSGRIKQLVDFVSPMTRLVLVNAFHMKKDWKYPFDKRRTFNRTFYSADGTTSRVPMMQMYRDLEIGYSERMGCSGLKLPYNGEQLSLVILLPDEDRTLTQMEETLTSASLRELLNGKMFKTKVKLRIPRLEQKWDASLIPFLQAIGIRDVFDPQKANLSGIAENAVGLYVSQVIQSAAVGWDEEGSRASAATASVFKQRSLGFAEEFVVNRPFLFFIGLFNETEFDVLFIGRYNRPA